MTASTAHNPRKSSQSALLTPAQSPRCEVLFELFEGELGRVQLGRMLSGSDAGRLVTLRQLNGAPSNELTHAVDVARSISSPRLRKTLGTLRVDGQWQLASEYLSGVALSELTRTLEELGEKVDVAVAICITLDILSSTVAARDLLEGTGNAAATRCLHAEGVWLADFGETFLGEVPASSVLADETGAYSGLNALENAEAEDVRTAGHLLLELATGSFGAAALEDPALSPSVRQLVARATRRAGAEPFSSLHEFAEALGSLEPGLIATDEQVSEELRRLMGPQLEIRRQKVAMTERAALGESNEQDETKFFRAVSVPAQRETARPPAAPPRQPPLAEAHSNTHRIAPRSEPPDQPTTIFKRPDLLIEALPEVPNVETARGDANPNELAEAHAERRERPVEPPSAEAPVLAAGTTSSAPAALGQRFITPRRALLFCLLVFALLAFGATTPRGTALTTALGHWAHQQFPSIFH